MEEEKGRRKKNWKKEERGRAKGAARAGTGLAIAAIALALCVLGQSALAAQISVDPACQKVTKGDYFTVDIYADPEYDPLNPVNETLAGSHNLYFNNTLLNATSQVNGTFLSHDGASTHIEPNKTNNTYNDTHGVVEYGEYRQVSSGVTNAGVLATITFEALADGFCELWLGDLGDATSTELINVTPASIPTDINNGSVRIGICGDVSGNDVVTGYDYTVLKLYIGGVPGWTISSEWTSDVSGNGVVTGYDYTVLKLYIGGVPGWELNCCCDCWV